MQSLPFLRRLLLPLPRQLPRPASSLPSPVQSSAQKVPTPRSSLPPPLFPELRVFSDAVALALRWTYLCIRRCPAPRQAPWRGGRGRCLRGCTWRDPGFLGRRAGNGAPQAGALLRGVLSPESESSPRARPAEGEKRSRASRDHLWVQPKSRLRPAHPKGSSGPGDTADSFRFEARGAELLNTRDPNNQSLAAGCPPSLCV